MADKRIQDLTPATSVGTSDRFVLEQSGQAKSLTGQILINDLAAALDGHGGISNVSYVSPVSPSLDGTLTITTADGTSYDVTITNGNGITGIDIAYAISEQGTTPGYVTEWYASPVPPTDTNPFQWTRIRITDMANTVTDAYSVSMKAVNPSMSIGSVYAETGASADATVTNSGTSYNPVFNFDFTLPKGDKGDTGDYIDPVASFGTSTAATTEPTTWYNSPSSLSYTAGNFIWQKTEYVLHEAQTVQSTEVKVIGYIGQNGTGAGTVTQITFNGDVYADDGTGNVTMNIDPEDVGAIADPANKSNGQVLTYDSSAGEWVAATPSTGSVNTVNNKGVDVGTTNITIYGTDIKVSSSDNTSVTAAIPQASSTTPAALGTAAVGTGTTWARADHVHKKPTASDLSVVDIMCGTELTTGTNLNDLGFGVYHCPSAAVAASLVNSPSSNNGFRLEVKQTIESSSRITQIAYLNNVQRIYYRNLTSTGWTSWILIAGTVSDSPTMEQGMGTLSTGSIRKSGNVVHLNMYVTGTTIGTSAATLATIPSEYYPPSSVYGVAVIGTGPDVAFMEVTTTGNVRIRGGSAQSSVNIRLGITWINT